MLTTKYNELDDKTTKMLKDMKDAVQNMKFMFLEAFKQNATSQSNNGGYSNGTKTQKSDTGINKNPLSRGQGRMFKVDSDESSCGDFVQSRMICAGGTVRLSQHAKKKQRKKKLNNTQTKEIQDYFSCRKIAKK